MRKDKYTRLTNKEREDISRGLAQRKSIRVIAGWLGRSPSTVTREIKRNSGRTGYRAFSASQRAKTAAASRKEAIKAGSLEEICDRAVDK